VEGVYDDILSVDGLNALIFNDPYAKLCFTSMLASRCCLSRIHQKSWHFIQKKVTYIDLDTTFSAYLRARLILKQSTITMTETRNPLEDLQKSIKIYLPTEGNFESILNEVMDSMSESCLIIFDSVNSFYNLYYKKINIESGFGLRQRESFIVNIPHVTRKARCNFTDPYPCYEHDSLQKKL